MPRAFLPSLRIATLAAFALLALPARAASYGGPAPSPQLEGGELRLASQVREAIRKARGAAPGLDARLAKAAHELATWAARADDAAAATSRDAVRLALARQGSSIPEPTPFAVRATAEKLAFDRLAERAAKEPAPERLGVGVATRQGVTFAVLLIGTIKADLDPFPASVSAGSTQVLSGRLLGGLAGPQVYVTPPGGTPVRLPVESEGAAAFRARIAFATRGRHVVEVLAAGARGPEVAAMISVFAGGDLPFDPGATVARSEPADGAGKEKLVAREVDGLREARGLRPFTVDPRLTQVARSYAQEIARTGHVAHRSEESGELGDRLGRARYAYVRASENLAQAPTALEAHRGTVESPGHLANLLDPDLSHAGYGVAAGRTPGGSSTLFLVEVFARPPASSPDPAGDALQALQARRRELGYPALRSDERLQELAQREAERLAAHDDPGRPARELPPRVLQLLGPGFTAGAEVLVAAEPGDAAAAESASVASWERVAVGAAPAREGSRFPGRTYLVIVMARRAPAAEVR